MQPRLASSPSLGQPDTGLALAAEAPAPAALAPLQAATLVPYAAAAMASPVCVAAAVFAACVGLGLAGAIGAVVAVLAVLGIATIASRSRAVRRHLDAQAALRERCRRETQRLKLLRPSGPVRQQQYLELRELVEHVERTDAREAARFELQDLLDHFVSLSQCHQRCLDALRISSSHELPQAISITEGTRGRRRREIMARRLRHREQCLARIERLADEIDAVDELVRLVAQRAACPELDPELDRELERRLWELDEVDDALKQLSA